jgi:hypothetical protein
MASEPHRQHRELVICSRQSRDGDHLDVHVAPEARDLSHYIVAWFRVRWDPGPHPNPLMLTSTGESFATVQAMALAACSSYCLAVGQSSLPCSYASSGDSHVTGTSPLHVESWKTSGCSGRCASPSEEIPP